MTVGGVTVTNQYFASVTRESSEFQGQPIDGLLGMGLPALSNLKQVWQCEYRHCIQGTDEFSRTPSSRVL